MLCIFELQIYFDVYDTLRSFYALQKAGIKNN